MSQLLVDSHMHRFEMIGTEGGSYRGARGCKGTYGQSIDVRKSSLNQASYLSRSILASSALHVDARKELTMVNEARSVQSSSLPAGL